MNNERKHGRWVKAEYAGMSKCDQCGNCYIESEWVTSRKWNYCPECGANMTAEEETDDES